ncbi:hypothetical protein D3C85_1358610 [compost metagenome]
MVPHLGGVVEDATGGFLDDFFQRGVLELGTLDQVVQVGDVGLVMLAVVEFQGFLGNDRCQGVQRVRQFGQFVFHRALQS